MQPRAKYLWIVVAFLIATGCDDYSERNALTKSSEAAKRTANSVNRLWVDLNAKAEKLDPQSSLDDLERQKEKLTGQISALKEKAGSEYELLQAQYKRLDAAEQLKKVQAQVDRLKETGKSLQTTADKASQGLDDAKRAYQTAQDKYTQVKQQAEKVISGSPSLP